MCVGWNVTKNLGDLFYDDKTMMLFGDGKKMMTELVSAMKES